MSETNRHTCIKGSPAFRTGAICEECKREEFMQGGLQKFRRLAAKSEPPAPAEGAKSKPRVFIDMDGVVVNFDEYKNSLGLTGDEVKKIKGAYLAMKAFPEALAGIKSLVGAGFDVWLATKPPTGIAHAYADKAAWVFENIPELKKKIIITHDKGLLGCEDDFLIDDRPHKANCEKFRGTLIRFLDGMTWEKAIEQIKTSGVAAPAGEEDWRAALLRDFYQYASDAMMRKTLCLLEFNDGANHADVVQFVIRVIRRSGNSF